MAVQIPREFVREVVDRTSIVSLVSQSVRLQKKGSTWSGLCPFHSEKSPSFYVNEDRKNFHCFGCDASGDAIDWLQRMEGLGFIDAVKELADRCGMQIPQKELSPQELAASKRREQLMRANELACSFFEQSFHSPAGADARAYWTGRGYDLAFAKEWRVGFAPESWDSLGDALAKAGVSADVAVEAGLLRRSDRGKRPYDFFRNRLIFPILGTGKKVIAFGGRTLGDDKAKYINTPETPVYNKSKALFGLHENRSTIHREDRVFIVEGYFDVLALANAGLGFAVAPCGTALTDRQLGSIRRHTQNVTMLFDSDNAGRRAALRTLEMCLDQGLWPQRLEVAGGKDPDEYLQEHGAEAMRTLITEARPLLDFFVDTLGEEVRANERTSQDAIEVAAAMLARLGRGNARAGEYTQRLIGAVGMHVDPRLIDDAVRKAAKRIASQPRVTEVVLKETDRPRIDSRPAVAPVPRPGPGPDRFDDFGPEDDDDDYGPSPDELAGIDFDSPAGPPPTRGAPPSRSGGPRPSAPPAPRRPPEPEPTAAELMLLGLLVEDLPNVAQGVLDRGVHYWVANPTVLRVVERFLACHSEGRNPTLTDLVGDVENPTIRARVASALASEAAWYGPAVLEEATKECMLRLRREYIARRYVQVKRDLDAIQRSGRASGLEVLELTQESLDLQREREEIDQLVRRTTAG